MSQIKDRQSCKAIRYPGRPLDHFIQLESPDGSSPGPLLVDENGIPRKFTNREVNAWVHAYRRGDDPEAAYQAAKEMEQAEKDREQRATPEELKRRIARDKAELEIQESRNALSKVPETVTGKAKR